MNQEEHKLKRHEYYLRWKAKKLSTPEGAAAFREETNKAARDYMRLRRATDPVYKEHVNKRQAARYHAKIKPNLTDQDRERLKENSRRFRATKLLTRKLELQQLLGGKCASCGITDSRLLDFDHIDQYKKTMLISQSLHKDMDILLEEIKNCQLLCCNCHRIRTIEQHQYNSYTRKTRDYRNKNRTKFEAV